jgi:hypothetical protein
VLGTFGLGLLPVDNDLVCAAIRGVDGLNGLTLPDGVSNLEEAGHV